MKLVTAQEMRELEQRADTSGNSYARMMDRAGTLVAQAMQQKWDVRERRVLVLVGPGNNGGDGLVCARVLHDAGASVRLYVWKRDADANDPNWKLCIERSIPFIRAGEDENFEQLQEKLIHAEFIVDALLGTGVSRPLKGTLKHLLETVSTFVNRPSGHSFSSALRHPFIVAVDLPTGLNPDTGELDPAALAADLTVTFAFPKIGHYAFPGANAVGELVVVDIGIPVEWASDLPLTLVTADDIRALLPHRPRDANKGTFGKTMIASGSLHFSGAPILAARAAGRSGTGLVTLAVPQAIHSILASKIDEATFIVLTDRLGDWRPRGATEMLEVLWDNPYDALLVGCGMGRALSTREFLERLLENLPTLEQPPALILDADALNHLAEIPDWSSRFSFPFPPILTPHPGEMARLTNLTTAEVQSDRVGVARDAAQRWNAIVVLKGAYTIIAAPDGKATLIPFANSALATAGTGDVLAGTIAGILAQYHAGSKPDDSKDSVSMSYNAAIIGTYLHARAGELAAQEIGGAGMVAGDLLMRLPLAIRTLGENGK